MKIISRRLIAIAYLLCAAFGQAAVGEPVIATRPDVRVVIDISGSMKQNDPHNLRKSAFEMLIPLFPKNAKAGVWTFGESVDVMVPAQAISDAWRALALSKSAKITSSSLYTNIPAALDQATAANPENGYRTSVILLTDGMVDISKSPDENTAARQRVLNEILPRLRQAHVTVYAIALSKSADRELMERLAVDTGGLFAVAETAEQLHKIFLQAFDAAAPAEQVPLQGNRFLVDSSIDELTTLVFHKNNKPVELISPDNKHHSFASHGDDFKWFQGQGYDLITVKKPFEGEWNIVADLEKGSRVTIVSNLSLSASRFAESLFKGDPAQNLVAALTQQGEVVKQTEFLQLVKVGATVQRREDGQQWQIDLSTPNPTPADGYFRAPLAMLNEIGTYDIAINAVAKTFERSQKQTLAVRDNFDVRVSATDSIPPAHHVTLFAQNPEIDAATTTVTAHIKAPDGKSTDQAVTMTAEREWPLALDTATQNGRFEVSFDVAGQYKKGEKFTYRSAVVAVDQSGTQVVTKAEAPQPVVEKHDEPKAESKPADEKPAAPAPAVEEKKDWKKWALYGGLAFGNLLIIGLGFLAYRMIMGGNKSEVLETPDDDEDAEEGPAKGKDAKKSKDDSGDAKAKEGGKAKRRALDLPDDAIDIDDKKK